MNGAWLRLFSTRRTFFKEAKDFGYIETYPFIRIKHPSPSSDEMDHLTTEEIELVLIHMDQRTGIFFSILAYAGLRKGEALALKRKNLDFDSKEIRVTNSWSAANRYFEPKTEAAKRRVRCFLSSKPHCAITATSSVSSPKTSSSDPRVRKRVGPLSILSVCS